MSFKERAELRQAQEQIVALQAIVSEHAVRLAALELKAPCPGVEAAESIGGPIEQGMADRAAKARAAKAAKREGAAAD